MLSTLILLASLFLWPLLVLFPNMQPRLIRRRLPWGIRNPRGPAANPNDDSSSSSAANDKSSSDASEAYEPSALDVVVAKMMLQQGLRLPPEVVLSVLDFAEYWPHSTATLNRSLNATAGRPSENLFVLRSRPLGLTRKVHYDDNLYAYTPAPPQRPSEDPEYPLDQFHDWIGSPVKAVEHPCRKIVFTITSHDQGWGGDRPEYHGTYQGSYTWFEAGLERFDKNAERPKDTTERDPAPLKGKGKEQEEQQQAASSSSSAQEPGEPSSYSPSSSSSSFVVVAKDTGGGDGGQEDLPHPYLPVYSLRPIQPTLQPDRDALHHTLTPPPEWTIQCNKTATREWTTHKVVWSWEDNVHPMTAEELSQLGRGQGTGTGAFMRDLKLGDVVTIWAKARFGGWANHVRDVKMDIYWAL